MNEKKVSLRLPWDEPNKENIFHIIGSDKDKSIMLPIEMSNGFYEPHVLNLMKDIIKKDNICIDIGANIGVISLVLSKLVGENGKVYSIEASKNNYNYLLKNIEINKLKNIVAINQGVWDCQKINTFSYVEEVAGCSFFSSKNIHEGYLENVTCKPLKDIFCDYDIKYIDFIKLDVEGSEIKVIQGGYDIFLKFKPHLIVEYNPIVLERFFGTNPKELYNILNKIYVGGCYYVNKNYKKNSDLIKINSINDMEKIFKTEEYIEIYYPKG
jgi:FkbM family methyltransferase